MGDELTRLIETSSMSIVVASNVSSDNTAIGVTPFDLQLIGFSSLSGFMSI